MDWAFVEETERNAFHQKYVVLYSNPGGADGFETHQVSVRLQGFVQFCDLRPLGNWNGYVYIQDKKRNILNSTFSAEQTAHKATQSLTLVANGHNDAFQAQVQSLENLRDLVFRTYNVSKGTRKDNGRIEFSRRVFTKGSLHIRKKTFADPDKTQSRDE